MFTTNNKTIKIDDPSSSKVTKRICAEQKSDSYGIWKDKTGATLYYQVPANPGDDQFVYLFDVSGNEIVRSGGFVTIKENEEKYGNLTQNLSMISMDCFR